ncbi:hypothetical protein [Scytonema sp. PCC 10023]|uniref:hypothetical protein n=1 Tax=Scytonema sp. PCC 10023 TaxID=1680591 RepID=UPI0039C5BCD2
MAILFTQSKYYLVLSSFGRFCTLASTSVGNSWALLNLGMKLSYCKNQKNTIFAPLRETKFILAQQQRQFPTALNKQHNNTACNKAKNSGNKW